MWLPFRPFLFPPEFAEGFEAVEGKWLVHLGIARRPIPAKQKRGLKRSRVQSRPEDFTPHPFLMKGMGHPFHNARTTRTKTRFSPRLRHFPHQGSGRPLSRPSARATAAQQSGSWTVPTVRHTVERWPLGSCTTQLVTPLGQSESDSSCPTRRWYDSRECWQVDPAVGEERLPQVRQRA